MIKTIRRIARIIIVGTLFLIPMHIAAVSAQTTAMVHENSTYVYTAAPGDSLSRMARHSIQLYEVEKKITLEPSMAIYCESVITSQLGNIQLEIGQQVTIPKSSVENCSNQVANMPADQLVGWSAYADQISFDTSDLHSSDQKQGNSSSPDAMSPQPPVPAEPAAPANEAPLAPASPVTPFNNTPKNKETTYRWLLVTAGTILIVYFLFGDRFGARRNN